jgi:hypothetical protein
MERTDVCEVGNDACARRWVDSDAIVPLSTVFRIPVIALSCQLGVRVHMVSPIRWYVFLEKRAAGMTM